MLLDFTSQVVGAVNREMMSCFALREDALSSHRLSDKN